MNREGKPVPRNSSTNMNSKMICLFFAVCLIASANARCDEDCWYNRVASMLNTGLVHGVS